MFPYAQKLICFADSSAKVVFGRFRLGLCLFIPLSSAPSAEPISNVFIGQSPTHSKSIQSWPARPTQATKVDLSVSRTSADDGHATTAAEKPSASPAAVASQPDDASPQANAGDDVLAFVGRKATLNGGQSLPAGRFGVRWIQISGPPITEAFLQGPNLIVVPPAQGHYQFLLVVASGSEISEPDHVTLTAVSIPPELQLQSPQAQTPAAAENPVRQAESNQSVPKSAEFKEPELKEDALSAHDLLARLAHQTLENVPHDPDTPREMAQLFSDIAGKMDLYASYSEVNEELSRRIVLILKNSNTDFSRWTAQVFEPLTTGLSLWVKPAGLDLRDQNQWQTRLNQIQRQRLSEGFLAMSRGFQGKMQSASQSGVRQSPDTPQTTARPTAGIQK